MPSSEKPGAPDASPWIDGVSFRLPKYREDVLMPPLPSVRGCLEAGFEAVDRPEKERVFE
jgi:hypothetical protein